MPDDTIRFAARAEGRAVILALDVPNHSPGTKPGTRNFSELLLDPATARALGNDLIVAADAAEPIPPTAH